MLSTDERLSSAIMTFLEGTPTATSEGSARAWPILNSGKAIPVNNERTATISVANRTSERPFTITPFHVYMNTRRANRRMVGGVIDTVSCPGRPQA